MVEKADYESAKRAYDKNQGHDDVIVRFRGLIDIQGRVRDLKDEIESERKKRDTVLRDMKEELTFFNRHNGKVAQLRHAMLKVYRNPEKAFRAFEALLGYYSVPEVLARLEDSPFELGTLHGVDILVMKSPPRDQAIKNYSEFVIPTMKNVIDDHAYFVRAQSTNWGSKIEEAEHEASETTRLSGEIELLSTQVQMDQLSIAKDLSDDDVARLSTAEKRLVEWMKDKADRAIARLKVAQKQAAVRASLGKVGPEEGLSED